MFRFLTVDNDEDLLGKLNCYLSEWFPGSTIETATTVDEGLRLIRNFCLKKMSYDAAILDFELPLHTGFHAEIDESLCREIQDTMSSTLVIHITGHKDDPKVLDHLGTFHEGRSDPRSVIIDKGDVHWVTMLEKKAKARLYGDLIEQQMEELFGPHHKAAHAGIHMRAHSGLGEQTSITMELDTLFGDIATYWFDLDENLQRTIRKAFFVDTESDPIRISLLL
jgi:hypothetical protein